MIPSKNWFPQSLQERAAWYAAFNANFSALAVSLGFTVADSNAVDADNDVMQFLANAATIIENYMDAAREYRNTITEGDIGDPTPIFPAGIAPLPPVTVPTGLYERLDLLVKRIRVAPGYTNEIGASLGILPSGSNIPNPADAPPKITASVDPGNVVEIKFVKGTSDGIYIETNVDDGGWTFAGTPNKSPALLNIPANTGGTPRNVMIRARYLVGNNPVGDWSDIVNVQTMP